jgi:protein involved in polysaccharide export with SLBB domain
MRTATTARPSRDLALWLTVAALLPGCAATPGNLFGLFPSPAHRLIDAARDLRAAQPLPVDLPRELDKRVAPPYTVEPGDVLLVQAADLDSPVRLPGDQPILPDGTIQLGKYGRLQVAGRTVEEVETAARALIQAQVKERDVGAITVRLVNRASKAFYVLGEVNAPGSFTLSGRETVLDGILLAGGLTERASRNNVILVRPTGPNCPRLVLPVCYSEIVQVGDTSTNYQIAAGDRVYVPGRDCGEDSPLSGHRKRYVCPPCGQQQVPAQLPPLADKPCCLGPAAPLPPAQIDAPRP